MQKCNPSRTSTRVYNWPKHQIKGAASASKPPLEFLCLSVQGDETTQGFNFHFKPTQILISHLLSEFWGRLHRAHRGSCSAMDTSPPHSSPSSHMGCNGRHQTAACWHCHSPPRLWVGGGAACERRLQSGESAGLSGTAFNYHEPHT